MDSRNKMKIMSTAKASRKRKEPDEIEDDLYAKNQIEFPNNKDPYFYKEPIIG